MEKKHRLLIVEDEARIGELIRKLIHWDELGLECQGVALNGQIAYDTICTDKPDIVITDIRMPKISGLDLIEMSRKLFPDIRFIVLSGYKEFEYAHRALQYEVEGYLLKPINEEELNETLHKVVGTLKKGELDRLERQKMRQVADQGRKLIKRDFLLNIIEQEGDDPDAAIAADDAPVELTGGCFRGIDIKLDCSDPENSSRRRELAIVEKISAIVEQSLGNFAEEVLCCEKEWLNIYCLFNYEASVSREIRGCIGTILSEITSYLMRYEDYEVTIGIGGEKTEFGQIRFSIREAYQAAMYRIRMGTGRLIYRESLGELTPYVSPVKGAAEELTGYIESYSADQMNALIGKLFDDYASLETADQGGIYEIASEIVELFFDCVGGEEDELGRHRKKVIRHCRNCNSLTRLKKYLTGELRRYLEMSREAAESESARPVRLAKAFVDEHYAEKIVLEDLADIVGLNAVYFSVLFKKETDMNFSQYLIWVRMEKAKELLRGTNETVAAIGEQVGYKDSRYFSQTFTKVVGIKPALYRRMHS